MAYRYGSRKQVTIFPPSIEDYVGEDSYVRAYDAIIDNIDLARIGIDFDENKIGNSAYDPRTMLKLLVFSYSCGVTSSRKIEKACHENLCYIWLMSGLKPDHKTICEFRRKNIDALKNVLKQTVRVCIKLKLVDGNVLFVDGSKFRGNANQDRNHTKKWCEEKLAKLDRRISELLEKCEQQDQSEANETSHVKMSKELAQKKNLQKKVKEALDELKKKKIKTVNITDPEARKMKGRQGSHSSYNVQAVVDEKQGIIVHSEAVTDANDLKQFDRQIKQANENTGKKCEIACADAGYSDVEILKKTEAKGIHVVVPSKTQASHNPLKPFHKSFFTYDKENDCYYCPEGKRLKFHCPEKKRKASTYKIEDYKLCRNCQHFGKCTKDKYGRRVSRFWNEDDRERFEAKYSESLDIYEKRKQRAELPFGHIKHNLGCNQFSLRGLKKVQGEISLLSSCFNISRMITLFGVKGLINEMSAMKACPAM